MTTKSLSLPLRLCLAATAVLVATTVAADIMAVREIRVNLAESVSASLAGMVHRMGRQVDADLGTLRSLLASEAKLLEGADGGRGGDLLARQATALNHVFDYGVLMLDASGRVVADSRSRGIWDDVDLSEAELFQRTFARDRPLVSEPFAAPAAGGPPLVMLTAPLRDADGRMVGMLAGGMLLAENRVLTQPTGVRASRFGQIGIFTVDGRVVAHTDSSILLDVYENPLPELGAGDDGHGTTEIAVAGGGHALLAASRLEEADWIIAGVFPSAEVNAPLDRGLAAAHLWFAGGLVASCALVWLVSARAVRDLHRLADEIGELSRGDFSGEGRRVGGGLEGEAGMMAGAINNLLDSLERAGRENRELTARLVGAEERERRSIAADLHDSVCQTLALANMRLGGVRRSLSGEAAETLAAVQTLLEQSVGELKTLTFNLSPGILYELGLAPALEWYAEAFAKKYGVATAVRTESLFDGLPEELSVFAYRAVGELMTNAAKHSGAAAVTVELRRDGGEAVMTVRDDGVGLPATGTGTSGFGLRSLRERARMFGGGLEVSNLPGGGVVASLRLPFPDA